MARHNGVIKNQTLSHICFDTNRTGMEDEVNGERMKAQPVREQNKRGGPASQRSHPKPSPTLQLYEDWRLTPIVPILQYHFAVVR